MSSFAEKARYLFWPAVFFFGILLIGALVIWINTDKPKSLLTPSKIPSESIDTNKPKSLLTPSKIPSESINTDKPKSTPTPSKSPSESIDTNKPKSTPTLSKSPSESIDTNKPKSTPTPSKSTNANSLDIVFLVILLILLAVSILTNVLFFKWRFRANDKQRSFVPEVLIDSVDSIVNDLAKTFKDMAEQHSANIDQSKRASKNTKKSFDDLMEAFTVLQTTLDSRDKEIQRLKKGYDSEIFRTFLRRFIRVDKALCEEINALTTGNGVDLKDLEGIQNILRDALEDCKVFSFSPEIGGDFRKEFGVADNPKTKLSNNHEDDFLIAEVIEEGFKLVTPEGPDQCIQPAKVLIFKSEKGD
jgi:cytoskeletal protein RodZ